MQAVSRIASDVDMCRTVDKNWTYTVAEYHQHTNVLRHHVVRQCSNISTVQQEQNGSQDVALWNTTHYHTHFPSSKLTVCVRFVTNDCIQPSIAMNAK